MDNFDRYFEQAMRQLEETKNSQMSVVQLAAEKIADCIDNNGVVQLVGVDHGRSLGMELGYRAGGLMPFHEFKSQDLATRGLITREEYQPEVFNNEPAFAKMWLDAYRVEPEDMFIFTSRTGDEPVLNELATMVKKNFPIFVVVSKTAAAKAKAEHPERPNLVDIADLVIDTGTPEVDGLIEMKDGTRTSPVNTLCNNVLAQLITAETYRYLKNHEMDCPILLSVNVTGADEHNGKISQRYDGRWNS